MGRVTERRVEAGSASRYDRRSARFGPASAPRSGRMLPELGHSDYREVLVRSYRIVYRIERDGKAILVLMVFEGHKLLDPGGLA